MNIIKHLKKLKKDNDKIPNRYAVVRLFNDIEIAFTVELLHNITALYEKGFTPEQIAVAVNRDADEIFLALFHQARQGKITKPFGRRYKHDQ